MRIALVQVASPDDETPTDRRERVHTLVSGIEESVDLIVLPELWRVGFNHFDSYSSESESFHAATVQRFSSLAADRKCLIHIGSIVQQNNGLLKNTSILLDAMGQIAHHYSKVHVFGYQSLESELLTPGDQIYSTATDFGVVSSTTCYDLRFPGLWTELVAAGSEIVIVPAAWPAARQEHWRLLTAARALDNQVFVIACNAVGRHGGTEFAGHSRIVDPWGTVVVEAGNEEGVTIAEIDPRLVERTRTEFPMLADRLDDYSVLNKRRAIRE